MRGYLYKKGDRKWQRRFFELRPASDRSPAELCYKETVEVSQPAYRAGLEHRSLAACADKAGPTKVQPQGCAVRTWQRGSSEKAISERLLAKCRHVWRYTACACDHVHCAHKTRRVSTQSLFARPFGPRRPSHVVLLFQWVLCVCAAVEWRGQAARPQAASQARP